MRSALDPRRNNPDRPSLRRLVLVGVFAAKLLAQTALASDDLFERYDIATGSAKSQTVLTGFFRGGASAELAVVQLDPKDVGRVRLYGYDDQVWKPVLEATLRPGVLFVDVARIDGRDRLLTYEPGRLNWLDTESATERLLVAAAFDYKEPTEGGIPYADVTRDLNGDGRDDLVMPRTDGFTIWVQRGDGTFAGPLPLGPPEPHLEDSAIADDYRYGEMGITPLTIPWYLGRIHVLDHDLDGRDDLVFWNRDHFDVHHQDKRGLFSDTPERYLTEVELDSDGEYSLQYGFTKEDSRQTVIHSFSDLDADGASDLVTLSLAGPGMLGKRTTFAVHFGRRTPKGVEFLAEADSEIPSTGIRRGLRRHDLDGDGRLDLIFSNVTLGLFKLAGSFVANSFAWDLEFFRFEDRAYRAEPDARRRLKGNLRGKNAYAPPVLIGDVDGDGRADLLFGKSRKELHVYLGTAGPGLFAERPRRLAVATPPDDESSIDVPYRRTRLVDLDRDGQLDILIDRGSDREPRSVTVLIAR